MSEQSADELPNDNAVAGAQRRRWRLADKVRMVEEARQPGVSLSFVARKYGIAPNLLFRWRKLLSESEPKTLPADDQVLVPEVRDLETRVRDLERLLGKKTMELELLKETMGRNGRRPSL
jgi:transposase